MKGVVVVENEEKYRTSDGYLAAYLEYKGFGPLAVDINNGWGSFVFSDSHELQAIASEFFSYKDSIPPRAYIVKYRTVIRALNEAKNEANKNET